jgi:cell division protein ZapA (FtsZ GTPase activity inhibitor)
VQKSKKKTEKKTVLPTIAVMTTRKIRNQKTKDYRTTKEERIQEKERQTVQLCTKKQHTCTGGSGKKLWGNTSDSVHRRRWYQDTN